MSSEPSSENTGSVQKHFHALSDAMYARSQSAQSRLRALALRLSLTLLMAGHRFYDYRGFGRSAELAYQTLFALVPVTALILMMLTGIDASLAGLKSLIFKYLLPASSQEAVAYLGEFVDQAGAIGAVSLIVFFFTAVSLLMNIDETINDLWEIRTARPFLVKLGAYWGLLTAGPLLVLGSFYLTTGMLHDLVASTGFHIGGGDNLFSYILSILFIWGVFFLMYFWLPHTRINAVAGLIGAIVAGTCWEFAKYGFDSYVVRAITYHRVYGSLSLIPLFLLWMYLSWIIVLWGAQITYVWQFMPALRSRIIPAKLTVWDRVDIAFRILGTLMRRFEQGDGRVSTATIQREIDVYTDHVVETLRALTDAGLVVRVEGEEEVYLLSRAPATISALSVIDLFEDWALSDRTNITDGIGSRTLWLKNRIRERRRKDLEDMTLQTLLSDLSEEQRKKSPVASIP